MGVRNNLFPHKRGFSPTELVVVIIIALALLILGIMFLTGTVGGAGKQLTRATNIETECIPVQTLGDCGICQQSCCHCPANCAQADKNVKYGENCS